jgi:chromosomal replication initiator protein
MSKALTKFIDRYRIKNYREFLNIFTNENAQELQRMIIEKEENYVYSFEDKVIDLVCRTHDVTRKQFFSRSRERFIIDARYLATLLIYAGTNNSLAKIGSIVGGKDHATILHAIKKMADLYRFDAIYRAFIDEAMKELEHDKYDCSILKQRLNEQRTIKTSLRIIDLKSTITRRAVDIIEVQDTENIVFATDNGGSGGILFGAHSVCVF